MAPITATSPPPPRWTPARVARIGVVTKSKYHCRERAEQPNYGVGGAARRGGRAASRAGSGGGGSFLEGPGDQDPVDLFAVQRLALEQGPGKYVELLEIGIEELAGARRAVGHDTLDLGIDEDGRLLAVVLGSRDLATEKDVLLGLAEGQRTHLVGHAPLADHLARHLCGLLEVIARAGGLLLEHDLLRRPAAQENGDLVDQVFLGVAVPIVGGQLHGDAERAPPRHDGDLVEGIGARQEIGHERMAALVIGGGALLGLGDDHGAPLHAHQHLVLGVLEVDHLHDLLVLPRGEERRLVHQVGEIRAREARGAAREDHQVDLGGEGDAARVHAEDLLAALDVGARHHHLAVEASRTQQSGIEDVGTVGGGDEDDAFVGLEAVHLDEELVEGLLALVVTAAQSRAPVPAHRVDLVHEDDAGGVLLALVEEIAHAGGAHAHEHLDEIRAGDGEERHVGLARDGLGEERLARAGRADEEHALGDLAPELLELGRVLEELDDLAQLLLGLLHARYVLEGDLVLLLRDQPRARLPEGQGLGAPSLHLAHEEDPDADEEQHGHPLEHVGVPGVVVLGLHGDLDAFVFERLDQVGVVGREGAEGVAVRELAAHGLAANEDLFDLARLHLPEKIGEDHLVARGLAGLEDVEEDDDDEADHHPEGEILVERRLHCAAKYIIRDFRYGAISPSSYAAK